MLPASTGPWADVVSILATPPGEHLIFSGCLFLLNLPPLISSARSS